MEFFEPIWDKDPAEHERFLANLAPIVLFTYNRMHQVQQTINALQSNIYAANSKLIIYSDGAKDHSEEKKIDSVRNFLHSIKGFKEIEIFERETNIGLDANIISGVTKTVNQYGKVIVLEDDIVTSRYFLKYMNDALEIYNNYEKVMEITGYIPFEKEEGLPETLFSRYGTSYGWGTWARSWKCFNYNPEEIRDSFSKDEIFSFCLEGYYNSWRPILKSCNSKEKPWDIFWIASIYLKNGLCLNPRKALATHIGDDGSGMHSFGGINTFVDISENPVNYFTTDFSENLLAREYRKEAIQSVTPNPILLDSDMQYINSELDYLNLLKGKDIIIFGAAQIGKSVLNRLKNAGLSVTAFCDNDIGKSGMMIEGVPVIPLSEIMRRNNKEYFIVLSLQSPYSNDVKTQLVNLGIYNFIDYTQIDFIHGIDFYTPYFIRWQSKKEEKIANALADIFNRHIKSNETVLDIGAKCGYLLSEINCRKRLGWEENGCAREYGVRVNNIHYIHEFNELPDESVDCILLSKILDEMETPLDILRQAYRLLRTGRRALILVGINDSHIKYQKGMNNVKLYSWTPTTLGNLIKRAGFFVQSVYVEKFCVQGEEMEEVCLLIAIKS